MTEENKSLWKLRTQTLFAVDAFYLPTVTPQPMPIIWNVVLHGWHMPNIPIFTNISIRKLKFKAFDLMEQICIGKV